MPSHRRRYRRARPTAARERPEERPGRISGGENTGQWEYRSRSEADTGRLGRLIGRSLQGGELIAMSGDLGTGKTTLVRGIATGLEAPPRAVSSPTFVLVQTYHGRLPFVHADLYRLETTGEFRHLGLDDYFDHHTVVAIEWAEKAAPELPSDRLEIHVAHLDRTGRVFRFLATGSQSRRCLNRVMKARRAHTATKAKRR